MKQVWKLMLPFAVLFCGCGGGDSTVTPVDPTVRSVPRSYTGLELVLSVPKRTFAVGEAITFTTLIRNTTTALFDFDLATNTPADAAKVAVYDKNNVLVSYVPGTAQPGVNQRTMPPNSLLTTATDWHQTNGTTNQPIPPGEYHADMHLLVARLNFVPVTAADLAGLRSETITFTVQ